MTSLPGQLDVLAAGLVAVDIVQSADRLEQRTGGSAGNVACGTAWLGATSGLLARIGTGRAADLVRTELATIGVDQAQVLFDAAIRTPRIVQNVPAGGGRHVFSVNCPRCRRRLPGWRPPASSQAVSGAGRQTRIFFFDRASRAALARARDVAAAGRIVFFEPNDLEPEAATRRGAAMAHVLKVSADRLGELSELVTEPRPGQAQIITYGRQGLISRLGNAEWRHEGAFGGAAFIDNSGAGDWVSIGLIMHLLSAGRLDESALAHGLRLGRQLASLSCRYLGARGLMYGQLAAEDADLLRSLAGFEPARIRRAGFTDDGRAASRHADSARVPRTCLPPHAT